MDKTQLALLIGLAFALIGGYFTARSSSKRQPIHGGPAALALHYIAAAGVTGILPVVLASLFLGGGFGLAFPLALSFMGTSLLALLIFAVIEQPAHTQAQQASQERGWTEHDARTSGL
jgi:hypothetical protein